MNRWKNVPVQFTSCNSWKYSNTSFVLLQHIHNVFLCHHIHLEFTGGTKYFLLLLVVVVLAVVIAAVRVLYLTFRDGWLAAIYGAALVSTGSTSLHFDGGKERPCTFSFRCMLKMVKTNCVSSTVAKACFSSGLWVQFPPASRWEQDTRVIRFRSMFKNLTMTT